MTDPRGSSAGPLNVLIVGAGVAGIEAALALRDLAGDRVSVTVMAPDEEFIFRPLSVREPFAHANADRVSIIPLLKLAHAGHVTGSLRWLDVDAHVAHSTDDVAIPYDVVLLTIGAHAYPRYSHSITVDPARLDEQLHGIIQDIEMGYVRSVAFIVPPGRAWPLPAYELALMTAERGREMNERPQITLLTPEPAPLAIFGPAVSEAVAAALAGAGIEIMLDAEAQVRSAGTITVRGRAGALMADQVIALPELRGPSIAGIPLGGSHGFIATDARGRVRGVDSVYAAGDSTDFPIKHGAIAAQQALGAAREIASLAGAPRVADPVEPVLYGILLGARRPLYMRARLVGGYPVSSEVSEEPLWEQEDKIRAPYLSEALTQLGG